MVSFGVIDVKVGGGGGDTIRLEECAAIRCYIGATLRR